MQLIQSLALTYIKSVVKSLPIFPKTFSWSFLGSVATKHLFPISFLFSISSLLSVTMNLSVLGISYQWYYILYIPLVFHLV